MNQHPSPWLVEAFAAKGYPAPYLLRQATTTVWRSGNLVAKVHHLEQLVDAHLEQALAATAANAVPGVTPLGVTETEHATISWWKHLTINAPGTPEATARWLRTLHDNTPTPFTPARLLKHNAEPQTPESASLLTALAPLLKEAHDALTILADLPNVFCHADANPTNIITSNNTTFGLDFGSAGFAPRVFDIATVAVLAVETGQGTVTSALNAYGPHPDITRDLLEVAATIVAAQRALTCVLVPKWTTEGWERVEDHAARRWYTFRPGNAPK
jgi:hypothetical protein